MAIYTLDNSIITLNGSAASTPAPPAPGVLPADMDFVYLATNFDGTKITNAAPNSTFGDYLAAGTVSKSGTGQNCYLYTDMNDGNYLYRDLTSAQLDAMKAVSGTYTYFCRVYATNSVGGIVSFRQESGGYIYMIRSIDSYLQIHTDSGHDLYSVGVLSAGTVFKVQVSGDYFYAKNMTTGDTASLTYDTHREMGSRMTSISAGYSGENNLEAFYGLAGMARATTEEEDAAIASYILKQGA